MTKHITANHCIFTGVPKTCVELDCTARRYACSTSCTSKFLHHSGQQVCSRSRQNYGNQRLYVSTNHYLPQFDKSTVSEARLKYSTSSVAILCMETSSCGSSSLTFLELPSLASQIHQSSTPVSSSSISWKVHSSNDN